jgi:hypothetical protein
MPLSAPPPATYVVHPGDALSKIAGRVCGDPGDFWALAYNNNVPDPNLIYAHQVFRVACQAAAQAIADRYGLLGSSPASPPSSPPVHEVAESVQQAAPQPARPAAQATVSLGAGTYHGSGGMQACIIARESGGNSQVVNASGHYGLYQFSYSTWVGSGGSGADFGHASVAEQNQVFANAVAARGYSDWAPYDGC